ncbi:flotillin family protein [Paraburkholderia sp. UCT31]|uniref:SPFH domain-containing protein n=1 Tax=Paraburkholderia sp. UCT31 TaxID=2615209 RepID=UPI00165501F8|nr:SPFH domain-containing protein [Paraburkholderia sp. UCT31]MBC8737097.1 flotillin family protein [Paraburkholderia sp. UCT31]
MSSYILLAGLVVAALVLLRLSSVVRYIPNNRVGIVEKRWSAKGSIKRGIIALNGEAGYQPDLKRGGLHFFPPFQYRVHVEPLTTISQNKIGYVFSRDGEIAPAHQALASNAKAHQFEDARSFLVEGGQKGPQRLVLRGGNYAINLALFAVITEDRVFALDLSEAEATEFKKNQATLQERDAFNPVLINGTQTIEVTDADGRKKSTNDLIGLVYVLDGPAMPQGDIIAPTVGSDMDNVDTFHNSFQDPERFLVAGGRRGLQHQVLVDGAYYINRLFATVKLVAKTEVPVGEVAVVVSSTGTDKTDVSGDGYTHGELVEVGGRGVWRTPLMPGKYPLNTAAASVRFIPTINIMLSWKQGTTGEYGFDRNLSEISLITKDAFEPLLPLSVVVHVDYRKGPEVIQRFGDFRRLVEQTLDPLVASFFKNVAQGRTLIELLQSRAEIQTESLTQMQTRFSKYGLELKEVLIGTPRSPEGDTQIEEILAQLRDRQVAVEQVATYQLKEGAAKQERTLREAEARAAQQTDITRSEMAVTIRENDGRAALAFAKQDAERVMVDATAQKNRASLEGEGEAAKITAIGEATARATKAKVAAYGGADYQLTQDVMGMFTDAIAKGSIPIVPQMQFGGGSEQGGFANNAVGAMMAMLLKDRASGRVVPEPAAVVPAVAQESAQEADVVA